MPARKLPAVDLPSLPERPRCGVILDGPSTGWMQLAMGEWELEGSFFEDEHPFDEVNYVLKGQLVVSCDGEQLELGPGESVHVPGGSSARYDAPVYARMVYVYGPNPTGAPSRVIDEGSIS
ncbi:MAG: cupin domain-containing protein [Acidimicrobiales bacterium]